MPGPRDPRFTPYVVDFENAFDISYQVQRFGRQFRSIVLVCAAQMGKTDSLLDVIGCRMDQRPAPIMVIGPKNEWLEKEFEPRLSRMLRECEPLRRRLTREKTGTKRRKNVGGVPVLLGSAGSPSDVASTAAAIAMVDELDRVQANATGEGDLFGLLEARTFSFTDGIRAAISTPSSGAVISELDEVSGLEFWAAGSQDDIQSPIWQLFQGGTRHHWCWPCPDCDEYFVPRMSLVRVPDDATPLQALSAAFVECPRCGAEIGEDAKTAMNARGAYVAPGQVIDRDGRIAGDAPESLTLSFWASGLCSPLKTIGERAAALIEARRSEDDYKLAVVLNTSFGECHAPGGGEIPLWQEVAELRRPTPANEPPDWAKRLTLAVDVQKTYLAYTLRAWGAFGRSRTIAAGEIVGRTEHPEVWSRLGVLLTRPVGGLMIDRALIDSGFRPGQKAAFPMNQVYEFCRRFKNLAYPSKGRLTQAKPVIVNKADLNARGEVSKYGLDLVLVDTDFAKSSVHQKVRAREAAENTGLEWTLSSSVSDDYCKQIVSEARIMKSGRPEWQRRSRDNHFLDCEAMHEALGHWLSYHLISEAEAPAYARDPAKVAAAPADRRTRLMALAQKMRR